MPAGLASPGGVTSPGGPATTPGEMGPGGRRASAVLREAADWVELFDVNTMSIYYRNNLTGKTRKTMPVEMVGGQGNGRWRWWGLVGGWAGKAARTHTHLPLPPPAFPP